MNYAVHLAIYFSISALLAMSVNLVTGYGGYLTFATSSFFAIGAYSYAITAVQWHADFLVSWVLAACFAYVLSLLLSVPSWRYKGDTFVVISLAVQTIVFGILYNWYSASAPLGSIRNLTNGPYGIAGISTPSFLGISLVSRISLLVPAAILLSSGMLVTMRIASSPFGTLVQCMRDDEIALRCLGKNTRVLKVHIFGVASAFAATAGILYAAYARYVDPSTATFDQALLPVAMAIVGGLGNLKGSLVGAAVFVAIPELLRLAPFQSGDAGSIRLLLYGCFLVILVHVRPRGIFGAYFFE